MSGTSALSDIFYTERVSHDMKSGWRSFRAAGAAESSGYVNGIQLPWEHTVKGPRGRRLRSSLLLTRIQKTSKDVSGNCERVSRSLDCLCERRKNQLFI
jgi:hypothetical protein